MRMSAAMAVPLLFAVRAASASAEPASISLPLAAEKLAAPPGVRLRSFQTLELRRRDDGLYAAALLPSEAGLALPAIDLRLLVPRVPTFAKGSAELSRIALIQREFNRNEVHSDLPGGIDFSLANNCLRMGLWEVKLARKIEGKSVPIFHAWLDFPRSEYAALFAEVNGRNYGDVEPLLVRYPKLGGLPVPLAGLRKVESEAVVALAEADLHHGDAPEALPEQQGKRKLILAPAVASYGDFSAPANQPVSFARFVDPGVYNPGEPMRCDLAWLGHPTRVISRRVRLSAGGDPFDEVEIDFANGYRVLFADSRISKLEARTVAPSAESDVLKIVSGIGTPTIHATAAERAQELTEDRPRYFFLLDGNGDLVDNHLAGVDGIYLWRESGKPDLLQVWIVGYERIAFVAHLSTRWTF